MIAWGVLLLSQPGFLRPGFHAQVCSFRCGSSESARKLLTRVEPEYPEVLRKSHVTGTVRLELIVGPNGNVEKVNVLGGNPVLTDSAVAAVKKWVYAPGHSRDKIEVGVPFDPSR